MATKDLNKIKAKSARYYALHREKLLKDQKQFRINRRLKVLQYYSKKEIPECNCCQEKYYEFLGIDHENGGGRKHRETTGANLDRWLILNNYPFGYRVLCHNCNISLGIYGYCPHNRI